MEYLKLFHAVCSEIDVLGKILASIVDTLFIPTKKTGINEWWYYLYNDDATIESKKCSLFGEHDTFLMKHAARKGKLQNGGTIIIV